MNKWRQEYLSMRPDRRDTLLTVLGFIGTLAWIWTLAGLMLWLS